MQVSLENLVRTGQLVEHDTDARQVARMLVAVRQSIQDARVDTISAETRLDAAYRAIMQSAIVALWGNGYRTTKSSPGHHMTAIQCLPESIGLGNEQMLLLDTFRVKQQCFRLHR